MKDCTTHRFALLHMVGQIENMGSLNISSKDAARLMGVSLPTALKYLQAMAESGDLLKIINHHRSNAKAYRWALSGRSKRRYINNHFKDCYHAWRNEAFS